jgi:hypothetical protein
VNLPVELEYYDPERHLLWRSAFFRQRQVVVESMYEVML